MEIKNGGLKKIKIRKQVENQNILGIFFLLAHHKDII
jgi:hypothetical protein